MIFGWHKQPSKGRKRWVSILLASGLCGCLLFSAYLFWPIPSASLLEEGITSTRVVDYNGDLLREIRPHGKGTPVPATSIPPFVFDAVVAVEDRYFYKHIGVNPFSILNALRDNLQAGEVVRGGSTLTMQVARALRGYQRRTIFQKMAEAFLALRLETQLTKQEILTLWLNTVYFGNQAYGIEAAAQTYFGKSSIDLNEAEGAFLAGLPQRPTAFDPYRNFEAAQARQHRVIEAMHAVDILTQAEAEIIKYLPISLQSPTATFQAPHFVTYIKQLTAETLHQTAEIKTTLRLSLQQDVESIIRAHLDRLGNDGVSNAAALVIENQTGNVITYVGSADFWDASIMGQNDGVQMLRQPGSALKPFTYALALASEKYTPASILPDIEVHVPEGGGAFSPKNYDKTFHGPVPLRTALASSYNVPAVRLLRELDPSLLLTFLQSTGIKSLNKGPDHYGVGLTLGNGEVRLFELARAYTMLARNGILPHLNLIQSTTQLNGVIQAQAIQDVEAVLDPAIAHLITDILADPEARAPAFGRYGPLELPFPVAVKTGTSKDYRDNWAVGYTPTYTVAVWVGNFDGQAMRRVSGVTGAGPLFHAIMQHLGPAGRFTMPEGITSTMICPISGKHPTEACPATKSELFIPHTTPTVQCDFHKVFAIDKRDGTMASDDTPAQYIEERLFTVYPDEYLAWAENNGLPLPPQKTVSGAQVMTADAVPSSASFNTSNTFTTSAEPLLEIAFPKTGMTFQIDPVLHPDFQKLKLRGVSRIDEGALTWWVNDIKIDQNFWPLQPGDHTITLRSTDRQGDTISSPSVNIRVLPALARLPDVAQPAETTSSK